MFEIASYKLIYASFHPFVDSLLHDAYRLTVDHYYCADQYCFTEKRLGHLSCKLILNILIINQHLCLKFVDATTSFLTKESLV